MRHPGILLSKKHSLTDVGNRCVVKNLPDLFWVSSANRNLVFRTSNNKVNQPLYD